MEKRFEWDDGLRVTYRDGAFVGFVFAGWANSPTAGAELRAMEKKENPREIEIRHNVVAILFPLAKVWFEADIS